MKCCIATRDKTPMFRTFANSNVEAMNDAIETEDPFLKALPVKNALHFGVAQAIENAEIAFDLGWTFN